MSGSPPGGPEAVYNQVRPIKSGAWRTSDDIIEGRLGDLTPKVGEMSENDPTSDTALPEDAYLMINNQVFPLQRAVTRIGRKLENDLVIQDMLVSREHATIRYENDEFVLQDSGSTSGTFINGKRVEKSVLRHGDLINMANVIIKFVHGSAEMGAGASRKTSSLS